MSEVKIKDVKINRIQKPNLSYVEYDKFSTETSEILKSKFEDIINTINNDVFSPADKTKAFNHLEIAYMWVGKGIRNDQITRTKKEEHLPSHNNQ